METPDAAPDWGGTSGLGVSVRRVSGLWAFWVLRALARKLAFGIKSHLVGGEVLSRGLQCSHFFPWTTVIPPHHLHGVLVHMYTEEVSCTCAHRGAHAHIHRGMLMHMYTHAHPLTDRACVLSHIRTPSPPISSP